MGLSVLHTRKHINMETVSEDTLFISVLYCVSLPRHRHLMGWLLQWFYAQGLLFSVENNSPFSLSSFYSLPFCY